MKSAAGLAVPPHRILVIRLTALGDVVLVEPVLRALRARWPRARIDLLTDAAYAGWARGALGADTVWAYDRQATGGALATLMGLGRRLRRERYQLVLDLQGKLRTRALAALIGAATWTFRRRSVLGGLLALLGHDPPEHRMHAVDRLLAALAPMLGRVAVDDRSVRLARAADSGPTVRIGIGLGASRATKRWPAERFGAVAAGLSARYPNARFVPIGAQEDRGRFEAACRASGSAVWIDDSVLEADVEGLAAAVAGLDLLITNDSGPAHLAAGYGVPSVVIFGPTSWIRWGPRPVSHHRVVRVDMDCAPCANYGGRRCPRPARNWACMRALTADRVLDAAAERLAAIGWSGDPGPEAG